MTAFHLDARTLAAYVDDALDDVDAWAVETHLDRCATCRARLTLDDPPRRLVEAAAVAWAAPLPPPGRVRPATRWRRIRVLVGAGPAARSAWLVAVALTGLAALGLAVSPVMLPPWLLLLAAPMLPAVGTALSYGSWSDPLHEMVASTPQGGLQIILWRTLAVLAVTAPVTLLAGAVTGVGTPMVWPLAGLALAALTLALGSLIEPGQAAAVVAGAWAAIVLAPIGEWAVLVQAGPVWLAVTAAAVLVVWTRRDRVGRRTA